VSIPVTDDLPGWNTGHASQLTAQDELDDEPAVATVPVSNKPWRIG